ncbi:MAG: NAD(P)-dependent alcohol dehydrogenase [Oceanococcaceae bacterium]
MPAPRPSSSTPSNIDEAITVPARMQAIVSRGWGPSARLALADCATPRPGPGDIQLRVMAASVNPKDWKLNANAGKALGAVGRRLRPFFGDDLAGIVTAVGENVTDIAVGDAIYGMDMRPRTAALAEYAVIDARRVAPKPDTLSFAEAASLPLAGQTALQGLRDHAHVQPGHAVLIIGAGGGVGTLAVQMARAMGCEVTAVCSARNEERARALGACAVIDYTREDFHRPGGRWDGRFDAVFDVTSFDTPARCRHLLKSGGRFVSTGGGAGSHLAVIREQARQRWPGAQAISASVVIVESWRADLEQLTAWVAAGQLRPIIDRHYPLADAQGAYDYSRSGRAQGKIVIDGAPA